jgi:hypothetical protein
VVRWPWPRAIAAGALAAAVLGFVFAVRAGLLLGPAVALILAFGVPARRLALAGGALLAIVVPILYLAVPVRDPGGFNTNLAVERIAAHWVGVAPCSCSARRCGVRSPPPVLRILTALASLVAAAAFALTLAEHDRCEDARRRSSRPCSARHRRASSRRRSRTSSATAAARPPSSRSPAR